MSGKPAGDVLCDGRIDDGAKLDKANQTSEQNRNDAKNESHFLKMLPSPNEIKLSRGYLERN